MFTPRMSRAHSWIYLRETPAFLLPQGGRAVSDVSSTENEGSEEKLFITEAEARCVGWGLLSAP